MKRKVLFGVLLGAVATLLSAVPAQAAPAAPASSFAAQAHAAGYTNPQFQALQRQVDKYRDQFHGRQVSLNKVEFAGGEIVLPLPGETTAREFGSGISAGSVHGCAYLYMCIFHDPGFSGPRVNLYNCQLLNIGWYGYGSWVNNQSPGTVGIFYGIDGGIVGTTGNPPSSNSNFNWAPVYSVRNC